MMAISRVFVKDLPPNISEHDFSNHFSQHYSITDVKLIPHRRIGFIGFKCSEDAAKAVKYFNKSFIRMSKIRVELAQPVQSVVGSSAILATPGEASRTEGSPNLRKRKREAGDREDLDEDERHGRSRVSIQSNAAPDHHISDSKSDKAEIEETKEQTRPATDAEWMQSHTNFLLDSDENGNGDGGESALGNRKGELSSQQNSPQETRTARITSEPDGFSANDDLSREKDRSQSIQDDIRTTKRLFIRNLSYTINEDDIRELFGSEYQLEEVHLPLDRKSGTPKGFAFIMFKDSESAVQAYQSLDGTAFRGRILHIIPAYEKQDGKLDEFAIAQLPLKKQKQLRRKAEASDKRFNWNSLYINTDAALSSVSQRLGIAKSDLLDPTSSDAAVKLAQAETHIIQEAKAYFESNGINLSAFSRKARGDIAILVKNLDYETTSEDLRSLFGEYGKVSKVLMPPCGTIAIVKFDLPTEARSAFLGLAYRKYKNSMLFLEKAPKNLFLENEDNTNIAHPRTAENDKVKTIASTYMEPTEDTDNVETSTLFVKNLNFETTAEQFRETFKPLAGFVSASLKTKPDPKKPGHTLSMGFGFVEFRTDGQAKAGLAAMNGHKLHGHQLLIQASNKGRDAAEQRRREDLDKKKKNRKSKIVIKNLPFEASKKDVRELLKPYGQLRAVRVPRKFDSSRKGFGFAEFTTPREAENAMDALRDTHLLGRRLILDFAAGEALDPEKEIEEMQQKVSKQSKSVAMQKLVVTERKKFDFGESFE